LKPEEAGVFRVRYEVASEATATYMAGRAREDVFSFHASHTRLPLSPAAREVHERRATEALRDAVSAYDAARQANPRDRIVLDRWKGLEVVRLLNEGRAHLRAERLEDAERAYRAATSLDAPWNRDEAWTGLGRTLLRLGKPLAARDALGRALAIYRGNRDALALMGEALTALGVLADARTHFAEAYAGGSGPADEDPATVKARDIAEKGGEGAGRAAIAEAEARENVARLLEEVAGSKGAERKRAVETFRIRLSFSDTEGDLLAAELARFRKSAADASAPGAERVRALSILAAAADPGVGALALDVARGAGLDAALAGAAVDAAAEGGGAAALVPFVDPANGLSPAVRRRALDRLAGIREARSMDAVLDALGDADASVRTAALAALFQLAERKDFDPDAPEPDRRAALDRLRAWWSAARSAWK
jgi:tetratricopeptide (TPR) repeat protein